MNEFALKTDNLPEAAKKELLTFYEYLVFKYLKKTDKTKDSKKEADNNLTAFRRFKKIRDHVNPVVDKSVDIDKLINEANRDIF